jgi:hypothetical protein
MAILFSNGISLKVIDSKLILSDPDNVSVELFADEAYEFSMMLRLIVVDKKNSSISTKTSSGTTVNIDVSKNAVTIVLGGIVLTLTVGRALALYYYVTKCINLFVKEEPSHSSIENKPETTYKSKIDIDFLANDKQKEKNIEQKNKRGEEEVNNDKIVFREICLSLLNLKEDEINQDDVISFQTAINKLINKEFSTATSILKMYLDTVKNMISTKDVIDERMYLKKDLHLDYPILEELYTDIKREEDASEKVIWISLYWIISQYIQVNDALSQI